MTVYAKADVPPQGSREAKAESVALFKRVRAVLQERADRGVTLGELRLAMLDQGVLVSSPELASCMVKSLLYEEVRREAVDRPPGESGRRRVWRYWWVTK